MPVKVKILIDIQALMVLDKVMDIKLPAYSKGRIQEMDIRSLVKDYLVLVFYPHDFTIICPTEVNEFSHRHDDFVKLKASVVFISCDSVHSHRAWTRLKASEGGIENVSWPMLSDYRKELSSSLLLLNEDGSSKRATIIVDKNMKIRHYSFNDNNIGRSVFEICRLLRAIAFYDEKGEMCMVNWDSPA